MPLYEYICEEDGTLVEVLRSMADADKPLPDPEGRDRRFTRKVSAVAALPGNGGGAAAGRPDVNLLRKTCGCGRGGCGSH